MNFPTLKPEGIPRKWGRFPSTCVASLRASSFLRGVLEIAELVSFATRERLVRPKGKHQDVQDEPWWHLLGLRERRRHHANLIPNTAYFFCPAKHHFMFYKGWCLPGFLYQYAVAFGRTDKIPHVFSCSRFKNGKARAGVNIGTVNTSNDGRIRLSWDDARSTTYGQARKP